MKRIILSCICLVALIVTACSDWIDVSPKTDVKSGDLFTSESGFKNALIGVYGRMTFQETYGRQMVFGYIERLVQRYDLGGMVYDVNQAARLYDYENEDESKNAQASIWAEMYKTIANINNLLGYLETNGRYIMTDGYYDLIKGEALGLRAFHYFDLLRMWGPVYSENPSASSVPFRERLSTEQVAPMPANELAQKILEDLHEADSLLVNDEMNYGYDASEMFTCERQYRMNKYAVKALMARVYLWIGDKEQAAFYAREVIDGCGLSLVTDNTEDVSMKEETIFGLKMDNMEEDLNSYWTTAVPYTSSSLYVLRQETWQNVFETQGIGVNDIRGSVGHGFNMYEERYMCRKYLGEEENDSEGFYENIPLIRLSEMYYILAECVSLEESVGYINEVRNARGISRANNYVYNASYTEDVRRDALRDEYSKDFFAEGQYFFFLKRHNYETFYRCPVERMIYYVFPIPDDEREFGLVDVEENVEDEN